MKQLFLFAIVITSLAGCASTPPGGGYASSQDPNGVPIDPTYRAPRTSIGVGLGSWGGRGFGGVGIGLGF